MTDKNELLSCPFCGKSKASKLDAPEPATKYLLIGYSPEQNELFPDRGFSVDAYGCAACKKVWLESPSLKIVDD